MNKHIQAEIEDITSILNHVESFTSCPHVKDAVPLLKIKYNRVKEYIDEWGFPEKLKMTHVHGLTFQKFWVNKTGKGEYQALHNHDGVFSFVAWLNIPYASEVEQCVPNTMHPEAGDFILTYTDIVGRTRKMNWKVDKQHNEGHLLLFPSDCYHAVYPHFLTDEKRISVAGDILLNSLSCVDVHNQGGIPLGYGYSNSQEFL